MIKKILALFLATITFLNYSDIAVGAVDNKSTYTITTEFNYSFAKEENWKSLSKQEKIESCQIPQYIADKMSTEVLLDSVLANPLMVDLLIFDRYEEGYTAVKSEIEVFHTLLERVDLYDVLVKKYEDCCKGATDEEIMNSIYLSVLMAQPEIAETGKSKSIQNIYELLEMKDVHIYATSVAEHMEEITQSNELMRNQILIGTYNTVYITTPMGNSIQALEFVGLDYNALQKSIMHSEVTSVYQICSYVSPASARYNCHSYAWYSQSENNPYWINHPYCDVYMTEGGYNGVSTAAAGDKIHWCAGDHSGIIVGVGTQAGNMVVISKYGHYGVYTAYVEDVPYSGSYSYYRKK